MIIKAIVKQQFTYIGGVNTLNKQCIKELEKQILKFIWRGKRKKVKKKEHYMQNVIKVGCTCLILTAILGVIPKKK